jgi:protein-L-isoaspartate O-methyltransferase|eukprot:g2309.t1 g2309   contig11:1146462-1148962(-)
MAWRSSGTNNTEMVDKMKRFGIISSDHVERGFRRVDRKFFVPRGNEDSAHSDQPLKEGNVHISAPHIYGSVIEALALVPNSCTSFLNIGSGTGYVSCIVAEILGPNSLNYGVELHADVIEHCKSSIAKWKTNVVDEQGDNSTIHFMTDTADIQIIKGNGLDIINSKGESVVGFDRIYIGAAVDKDALANISKLLSPGGILVGPVDDELVKIERVGNVSSDVEGEMEHEDGARSISGLSREFTSQILSGVRFAPLTNSRSMVQTVIPAHVWNPSVQRMYPSEFKRASMHLLMCSNSELVQPLPTTPRPDERVNVAAMLPKSIWVEILSFTHRKWFEPELNETEYLKRRLREEKAKNSHLERARRDAEERCTAVEREKTVYRMLAMRWQSRVNVLISRQGSQGEAADRQAQADEELSNLLDLGGVPSLSVLRSMLQRMSDVQEEEESSESYEDSTVIVDAQQEGELDIADMEEDHAEEEEVFFDSDEESDADDFASVVEEAVPAVASASRERNDSVVMEDVDEVMNGKERDGDQPRSVSMSSYDSY